MDLRSVFSSCKINSASTVLASLFELNWEKPTMTRANKPHDHGLALANSWISLKTVVVISKSSHNVSFSFLIYFIFFHFIFFFLIQNVTWFSVRVSGRSPVPFPQLNRAYRMQIDVAFRRHCAACVFDKCGLFSVALRKIAILSLLKRLGIVNSTEANWYTQDGTCYQPSSSNPLPSRTEAIECVYCHPRTNRLMYNC